MFRRRGAGPRDCTPRLRCVLPHTRDVRTGDGSPGGHRQMTACPAHMWPANDRTLDHDPFRSGIVQTTYSLYPANGQAGRVICVWLPPGTEPRPSWGEPPKRTPPARPTLSRRGVTRAGRLKIRPGRSPRPAALMQRHHPSRVTQDAPCRCRRPATKSCDRQADGTSAGRMMRRSPRRPQSPATG